MIAKRVVDIIILGMVLLCLRIVMVDSKIYIVRIPYIDSGIEVGIKFVKDKVLPALPRPTIGKFRSLADPVTKP